MSYKSITKLFMILGIIITSSLNANAEFPLVDFDGNPLVAENSMLAGLNKSLVALNDRGAIVYIVQELMTGLGDRRPSIFYKASESSSQIKFSEEKDQISGKILALYLTQDAETSLMKIAVKRGLTLWIETYRIDDTNPGKPHLEQVGKSFAVSDLAAKVDGATKCGVATCCAWSFIPICWCGCACAFLIDGHTEYSNVQFDSTGALSGIAHWYSERTTSATNVHSVQQVELFLVSGEDYRSNTVPKDELTKVWHAENLESIQFVFSEIIRDGRLDGKLATMSVFNKKESLLASEKASVLFFNIADQPTKAKQIKTVKSILPFLRNPDGTFEAIIEANVPDTMETRKFQGTFKMDGTFTETSSFYTPSMSAMFMAGHVYAFSPNRSHMLVKQVTSGARSWDRPTAAFAIVPVRDYLTVQLHL